jgi:hypothetical protein
VVALVANSPQEPKGGLATVTHRASGRPKMREIAVMMPGVDPLPPMSSRFPLSPERGLVQLSLAVPFRPSPRPSGMGFAVVPVVVQSARHCEKAAVDVVIRS